MKNDLKGVLFILLLLAASPASFCQDSSDVSLISESYDLWTELREPFILNDFAYLPSNGGFRILDVHDMENPELVGLHRPQEMRSNLSCMGDCDDLLLAGFRVSGYYQDEDWFEVGGWLQIYDVSNPAAPAFLSEVEFDGFSPSLIQRCNDTLFVAGDRLSLGMGWEAWWYPIMYLIDISDPASPHLLTEIPLSTEAGFPLSIEIRDNLIYTVIDHQLDGPAMWIVDMNQPEEPTEIRISDRGLIIDAAIMGDYVVIIGEYPDLAVVDITDPENCDLLGYNQLDNSFAKGSDVYICTPFAYVFSQYGIQSFDLSDPENISQISELDSALDLSSQFWIQNDRACAVTAGDELLFVELFEGDVYLMSHFAPELGNFYKVVLNDELLLTCGRNNGSPILNISDPEDMQEIGFLPRFFSRVMHICYQDETIYASVNNNGIMIYNAVNPDSVWFAGRFFIGNYHPDDFEVRDDFIYTCGYQYFRIADISDPSNTIRVAEYNLYAKSIALKDDYAYLGGGYMNEVVYEDVHILDFSDLNEIEEIGLIEMGQAKQVDVEGDLLFVSDVENQLHIFDISHPSEPQPLSTWSNGSPVERYYIQHPTIFIAAGLDGMRVVDYSQPDRPVETGFYSSAEAVQDIVASGSIVYAVDGRTLKAFDVSRALGVINESASEPVGFELFYAYPNPFNARLNISLNMQVAGELQLIVSDLAGRQIDVVNRNTATPGFQQISLNAVDYASGIYVVQVCCNGLMGTRKIVCLK